MKKKQAAEKIAHQIKDDMRKASKELAEESIRTLYKTKKRYELTIIQAALISETAGLLMALENLYPDTSIPQDAKELAERVLNVAERIMEFEYQKRLKNISDNN